MKTKSKIEEKKLTKAELEAREKVMKDLKKNKSALVKRYGKDAEAVMYGRATNIAKKMAESENKTRIKELVRKALMQEGKEFSEEEIQNVMDTFDMTREEAIKHLQQSYSDYKEFDMDEGKKEDMDKDGDIDSKDYLLKRDAAIKKAKGEMKEDIDLGHEDNEPHMIKSELYQIGKSAMELYSILEEYDEMNQEVDFPAWWQSKITTAKENLVGAKNYLEFEINEPKIDALIDKVTGEEPHEGEPQSHMMEGEISAEEKLAGKIAKALKDVANKDASDQHNLKQARIALNKGNIKSAKKIADPYLEEGFLDRMKAGVKGAVAGVGQAAKNVGAAVKGDPTQFKNVSNTANMAKLGQKVKTFGKEIDDVINDVNKLFPKEKLAKDPKLKATVDKYLATLNQTKTLNAAITSVKESNKDEKLKTEGLPKGFWDKKMKAKDETNESYETLKKKIQSQGKSAKAAGAIAGAIASYKAKGGGKGPTAKQLKEAIGRNYPEELDGEYEGEPQKIKGVDIYDTLIDILNISNSENDFIRKMTDSLTDETNVLSKSSEEKLRNWYKKNVTN